MRTTGLLRVRLISLMAIVEAKLSIKYIIYTGAVSRTAVVVCVL